MQFPCNSLTISARPPISKSIPGPFLFFLPTTLSSGPSVVRASPNMSDKSLSNGAPTTLIESKLQRLDLNTTPTEELQLAQVYTRKRQQLTFVNYNSDNDASDTDSDDGCLQNERYYHDNGQPRHFRTYQLQHDSNGLPYQRIVEEKHFDIDGVCRVDIHFALGQPYLYRKHYWPNQRLKSESVFWIEDEATMKCLKTGHWRSYYDTGNVESEIQYRDGVRYGFCKRYAHDGTITWVKDYTKSYMQRVDSFNQRKGNLSLSIQEACHMLGFDALPKSAKDVNSSYRTLCAPLHPDKTPDPDATEKFIQLSRARDVLLLHFENEKQDESS